MMHVNRLLAMAFATAITGAAAGCGSDTADGADATASSEKRSAWSCELQASSQVVCSVAQASSMAPGPAYACSPGDTSAQCPDEQTVQNVPGLADVISQSDSAAEFKTNPWACLVTGKEQIQCTRSCTKPTANVAPAGDGAAYDFDSPPVLPDSCAPTAWEPYFVQLASHQYHLNGVDIMFPREIFDTSQPLGGIPVLSEVLQGAGMSCHAGEWSTRTQAWLDAVSCGCANLADPILVLCQQAADYAPKTGKCSATGTW